MNDDFGTTLTLLLDDVAATINPRGDFEAVRAGGAITGGDVTAFAPDGDPRRFRRVVAIAAAAVLLVGAGAAAYRSAGDDAGALATSDVTTVESTRTAGPTTTTAVPTTDDGDAVDEPHRSLDGAKPDRDDRHEQPSAVARTAQAGGVEMSSGVALVKVFGTAPAGETVTVTTQYGSGSTESDTAGSWAVTVDLAGPPAGDVPVRVTFGGADDVVEFVVTVPTVATTEPKEAPTTEAPKPETPAVQEFTATLGWTEGDGTPLVVGLWGKAAPGSVIGATSSNGSGSATANGSGEWEMVLELHEVAPGARVGIRVTSSTSAKVHEFTAKAPPAEVAPEPKEFTAQLGTGDLGASPMKQGFYGTGTPGSVVNAESAYGSAETVVGPEGGWELRLKMVEVPAGTTVVVTITNSASDAVRQFELVRPAAPVSEFTANAAFAECDATPPYNEYWGKGAVGSTITISSPYGGGQVVVGADGKWDARIEFPDAPVGQPFEVTVTSTQGGAYGFPMLRIAPV